MAQMGEMTLVNETALDEHVASCPECDGPAVLRSVAQVGEARNQPDGTVLLLDMTAMFGWAECRDPECGWIGFPEFECYVGSLN